MSLVSNKLSFTQQAPGRSQIDAFKDKWRTVSKKLGDAALANEMALRVGHAATDQLVSAVIGHIQKERSSANGYARPKPIAPGVSRRPMLAGVTVDRSL